MARFFGNFENKIDRKGRVSIPAPFREQLVGQGFNGIIAFRSFRRDCIEAAGQDYLEGLSEKIAASYDQFSDDEDDLLDAILGDCHRIPFDGEGRVILPARLIAHAGMAERAAFVGRDQYFQIWAPEALEQRIEAARKRAREQKLTLRRSGPRDAGA